MEQLNKYKYEGDIPLNAEIKISVKGTEYSFSFKRILEQIAASVPTNIPDPLNVGTLIVSGGANFNSGLDVAGNITQQGNFTSDDFIKTGDATTSSASEVKFGRVSDVTDGTLTPLGLIKQWNTNIDGVDYFWVGSNVQFL